MALGHHVGQGGVGKEQVFRCKTTAAVLRQAGAAAEKSQLKTKQRRRKTAQPTRQVPPLDARAQMRAMVTWKVKLSATLHLVLRCKAFS